MKINIPSFATSRVLVVGDIILDRYWHGNTTKISPEAPVPVVHVRQLEERAGGAANVALNVAALGAQTTILGLVGNDEAATTIEHKLNEYQVNHQLLRVKGAPTINKLRVIAQHQQLMRLDFEEGFAEQNLDDFILRYTKILRDIDLVILSDYGKGTLRCSKKLIELAKQNDLPVLVDPKSKDFSDYSGATVITPNQQEFEAVVGKCHDETDIANKAHQLLERHSLQAIIVTRGAQGMSLICHDHQPIHIPTRAREVYDVTGAGDTVIATLGAALAAKTSLHQAMILANAAAGVVVRKLGTATISSAELRRAMQRQQDPWAAILSEEELIKQVQKAKAQGESIVMTNGCFDILHAGHVTYLEQAKDLGTRLIVAVNDDNSVKRLKGETRPINNIEQRMLMLAALRAVDWVVPFSEDTPERLIARILPNILAKGGDYQIDSIAGAKQVIAAGGKVEILPLVKGFSTTNLVTQIKNK